LVLAVAAHAVALVATVLLPRGVLEAALAVSWLWWFLAVDAAVVLLAVIVRVHAR
jgi:hypothetical protein